MFMQKNFKKNLIFLLVAILIYIIFFSLIKTGVLNGYYEQILILICINIILALSLNLITGFTGQLALGHAGFMSIGAYTAAMCTIKYDTPFLLSLLAGGLLAGAIGILIGLPILRLKGDYLAITTLGFGEIIRVMITNIEALGGAKGLVGIPFNTNFTWAFFLALLTFIVIKNVIASTHGRAMIAIREDEIAAEAMGVNSTYIKLMAFTIASMFAGIAGGLYAHYFMFIDPNSFNFTKSIEIVTFVVLGGMGSLYGSIIATSILTFLPELLRGFANLRMVLYPLLLIMIMLVKANGYNKKLISLFKKFIQKGGDVNVTSGS
jgi:branched-chain amino acid transport system permease protein